MVKAEPHNFKRALRALAAETPPGEHPSLDDLIAYREERLPEDEAGRLETHLGRCRACTNLLLELEEFNQPPGPSAADAPDFEAMLFARTLAAQARQRRFGVQASLLAAVLVAAVGLGLLAGWQHRQAGTLRQQVAELSQPQLHGSFHEFSPGTVERGGDDVEEMPSESASTLVLDLPDPNEQTVDEIRIVDAAEREVWRASGDEIQPVDGTLVLNLPRGFLIPGEYHLELSGRRDGQPTSLASYSLRVR